MYVSYYSKAKPQLTGDIDKELDRIRGMIVTKETNIYREIGHLQSLLGKRRSLYERATALNSVTCIDDRYTEFKIPKASGGVRTLHAPDDELKLLQKDIAKYITERLRVLPNNAAHAYVRKRNCKTALTVHQNKKSRWFLKIDLKDFFDSITIVKLQEKLTNIYPMHAVLSGAEGTELLRACTLHTTLPQGSPASPVLSNLFMVEFDYLLKKALGHGYTYTRYADDLLISSRSSFDYRFVVNLVKDILAVNYPTLKINDRKTRYGNFNGANWNLGLIYNNQYNITVGYRSKKLIKNRLHNLYRDKPQELEWDDPWYEEQAEVLGLLGYYKFIEPEYFENIYNKFVVQNSATE